jgi:hypothetical protein
VDGSSIEVDMIIYCTGECNFATSCKFSGYNNSLPIIKPGIIEYKEGVPQMVLSLLHPKYKNIYTFGLSQPRWGAGSLIVCVSIVICS